MPDLVVKGFIETSFLDWDGKIVSTIFLPFCNFKCPFCHNFGLINNPDSYETVPLKKIEEFILERKDFIDGICITGGEPCLHKDRGLVDFIKRVKIQGLRVKFDTNGTDPMFLKKLIEEKLVDFIAMDIKGPLDERYDKLSGIKTDINKIKESIKLIMGSPIDYEFRTTIVPGLINMQDVEDIAKYIKGAKKFVLQQFVPKNSWNEALRDTKPLSKEILEEKKKISSEYVPNTVIRGV